MNLFNYHLEKKKWGKATLNFFQKICLLGVGNGLRVLGGKFLLLDTCKWENFLGGLWDKMHCESQVLIFYSMKAEPRCIVSLCFLEINSMMPLALLTKAVQGPLLKDKKQNLHFS